MNFEYNNFFELQDLRRHTNSVPKKVMALGPRPRSRFFCDKHRFHVVPTVQRAQGPARGHQRLSGLIRSSPVGIGQGERVRSRLSLPVLKNLPIATEIPT